MSLDSALRLLDDQIDSYAHGTSQQPAEGSTDWFMLRALAAGRTMLLKMQQLGVNGDPAAAERFYAQCTKQFKLISVPPPPEAQV